MKIQLPLIALAIFCLFNPSFAQKEVCKSIYVWDFTDENGKKNKHTTSITQEVENALTETTCRVLQRRNYAKISEHIENEDAIQSIEGMPQTINQELKSIKAETVLFGEVKMDFSSNIMLSISFQNLLTKEILKSEFILLAGEEAHNVRKRQTKINEFIARCVGPKVVSGDETGYWQNVQQMNTVEAYESYLKKYKKGKYKKQAKAILSDEKKWEKILRENHLPTKFIRLENYTDDKNGRHYQEARDLLEELYWSEKKYDKYKSNFPDGKYAGQVDEKHEEYLYGKAQENMYKNAKAYLTAFPSGKYKNEVRQKYEEALYGAAIGGDYYAIKEYLEEYPTGKYASQVNAKTEDALYALVVEKPLAYADNYLAEFPNGQYLSKVEDKVWGQVEAAFIKHDEAEYYVKLFPKGKYIEQAKKYVR